MRYSAPKQFISITCSLYEILIITQLTVGVLAQPFAVGKKVQ